MNAKFGLTDLMRAKNGWSDDDNIAIGQFKKLWNEIHKIKITETGKIIEETRQKDNGRILYFEAIIK